MLLLIFGTRQRKVSVRFGLHLSPAVGNYTRTPRNCSITTGHFPWRQMSRMACPIAPSGRWVLLFSSGCVWPVPAYRRQAGSHLDRIGYKSCAILWERASPKRPAALTHQARPLVIKTPTRNQGTALLRCHPAPPTPCCGSTRGPWPVDPHPAPPQPRPRRHMAVDNAQRLTGQALAVLPDPVGVDRGDLTRRGSRH